MLLINVNTFNFIALPYSVSWCVHEFLHCTDVPHGVRVLWTPL